MRIGIFGGSFDPVHLGHLQLARGAAERLDLDQVRFIPTRLQPLKADGPRASAEDRVAMLRLALDGAPEFVIDRREVERPGPSYTIDSLQELTIERPSDQLFLLIGADAAQDLARWRDATGLAKLATIVVVPRPGAVAPALPPGVMSLDLATLDVSATVVRETVNRGGRIDQWVPAAVAGYVAAHGLYRTGG